MKLSPGSCLFDAIVIGAGPAGMMAAISAARRNKRILILEKNSTLGRKLLISGKGRCNLTSATESVEDFLKQFSPTGKFLRNAFSRYFNTDLIEFFENNRLPLKTEQGRRVFPQSDRAKDVLGVLSDVLRKCKVKVICGSEVTDLKKERDSFSLLLRNKKQYFAPKVILATGGLSYPQTGSDGAGLKIVKRLGHTVVEPRPGLVGVNLKGTLHKLWQGISLKNVECKVYAQGEIIAKEFGEMLFTHFGVSGPIILDLSAQIDGAIQKNKQVILSIDLKPALNREKLDKRLLREFSAASNKHLENILRKLMPRGLIKGFLKSADLEPDKRANQVSKAERAKLLNTFKSLRFEVKGLRPISEAIVTRGGISTNQINPKTMESRLVPGLYFSGEIIDVDAKTGGYNMQAAFSTGYICGMNI